MLRAAFLAATLSLTSALAANGQTATYPRAQLDYFVTRFEHPGAAAPNDGLGARLMWPLREGVLEQPRAWAGFYALHTPGEDGPESWRVGAQADAAVLRLPGGPVQGFVSVGAGVVSMASEELTRIQPPDRPAVRYDLKPVGSRARPVRDTGISLSPGVGARVPLGGGSGLRADLRRVWDFRRERAASTELSAGVSLPL
jgi:hypothetical protein